MLQQKLVDVSCRGELVILAIGNIVHSVEFDMALRMSAAMLASARIAKAAAGDLARKRRCGGTLTDASAEKSPPPRFGQELPARLKGFDVYPSGTIVNLQLGSNVFGIPYDAALTISQWLRLRGKEARNTAGERGHWSVIGELAQAEARVL